VKSIKIGDPKDPTTQMGPVINQSQLDKIAEFCEVGKAEGGKILCGGKKVDTAGFDPELKDGYYWEPTVIGDCSPNMRVVREEVFGPVVVAYPFKDEADAIAKANDSEFGLAASVWTKNIKKAHRVADQLDVGIVWLNDHHRNDPSSPWGGMKDSGVGRENGLEALNEYVRAMRERRWPSTIAAEPSALCGPALCGRALFAAEHSLRPSTLCDFAGQGG
jgi:acyl-CoA reductase-like NAD-dependent aldehyde dehydrogenase